MIKAGFIGWRGMVGSVLMERIKEENDFKDVDVLYFSTSQAGKKGPETGSGEGNIQDAYDTEKLTQQDILISCQGGGYTTKIYSKLRSCGWKGYWIDAASTLRMENDSVIVLDPVNGKQIEDGLKKGIKNYIGGNCTVSLMLMALSGLFKEDVIKWISSMTYQAASGAGAKNMRELITQMRRIGNQTETLMENTASAILDIDSCVTETLRDGTFPVESFGAPLAASLIPWIDRKMENGQTREEWKGFAETNKILGREETPIPIDGQCVRIGSMRCHSQAFTIKLKKDIDLETIENIIGNGNEWVRIIPNEKEKTLKDLTPAAISGTLSVPVGRIRKMTIGKNYLTAFSVGDQLLWGAAEPVRRIFKIIKHHLLT